MSVGYLKPKLQRAPPVVLESIVTEVWNHYGYTVDDDPKSRATGVDFVATQSQPYSRTEVLCVAHRTRDSEPIENSRVQQASALREQAQADDVILVTTGQFTDAAVSLAEELAIHVIDGDRLIQTIRSAELYATVADLVSIDINVDRSLQLETMAERVAANTDIESTQAVYEVLHTFFASHPSTPRIEENMTLASFTRSQSQLEWDQSTTVRWSTNPDLEAEDVAAFLANELPPGETPTVERSVVAAAVALELDSALGKHPSKMGTDDLARWCVDQFGETEVPVAVREPERAIAVAEEVVAPDESVAVNKLRVASECNRRFADEYAK